MRFMALLCLAVLPVHAADVTSSFETVKIAEGIYAFIAPEARSQLVNGNSVAIIGDDGVVVVDTGQIPELTRKMLAEIRGRTSKPVRYVVNTHWHWDHNLSNFVYEEAFPGVRIVSTPFTRQLLVDSTPKFLEFLRTSGAAMVDSARKRQAAATTEASKANAADDIADFESGLPHVIAASFVPPNETFDKAITIHLGKREVRIFHPGRANTAGDAVVYVPDARVLITGDVVVAPTPYATSSYLKEWVAVLKQLDAMDAAVIVPGHGAVQRDESYVKALTALLESLVEQVDASVAKGLSLEETQKAIDLETFRKKFAGDDRRRNRAFNDFFVKSAVSNAWKQARGEETTENPF